MEKTYYQKFGITESASISEIKKAYRKLALKYHPDKNNGDAKSENIFKNINFIYETLVDPVRRIKYDDDLKRKREAESQSKSYYNYNQSNYRTKYKPNDNPPPPPPPPPNQENKNDYKKSDSKNSKAEDKHEKTEIKSRFPLFNILFEKLFFTIGTIATLFIIVITINDWQNNPVIDKSKSEINSDNSENGYKEWLTGDPDSYFENDSTTYMDSLKSDKYELINPNINIELQEETTQPTGEIKF